MSKKIIITGGTGFVGQNLINLLSKNNLCFNLGRNRVNLCPNIYWNLKSKIDDDNMPDYIDTVVHCASIVGLKDIQKREYTDINVISTLELLEYCLRNKIAHFIYISTGGVYGFKDAPFYENDKCNPKGIYSLTKYFSEMLCNEYRDKIEITILRLFFPYGPGQKGRLISDLILKILNNDPIILNREGKPYINPIYIDDLCNILSKVIDEKITGIYNVSGDEIVSIKDICEIVKRKLKINDVQYIYSEAYSANILGSNEKICSLLNYKMQVKLEQGIEKTLYN